MNSSQPAAAPHPARQRLFHFACWLFATPLPDQPKAMSSNRLLDALARLVIGVVLMVILLYLIESAVEFADGFVQGWRAAVDGPAPQQEPWKLSRTVLIFVLIVVYAALQNLVLKSAVNVTAERFKLERERASRQELESTLRLLKAQIEPHFLFNSLGAVQQLAEGKAPAAAALTADLIAFLRATLPSLRADTITLADDCAICEAYLRIMQARLTRRLEFGVDCPPSLRSLSLPTALLLTLVENAVKHGIEPSAEGGRIDISAQHHGDCIVISVADTGAGFGETIGQGLGLQHVRERLAIAYEGKASLALEANTPGGVVARLTIPRF